MSEFTYDIFEPELTFDLSEAEGEVDGKAILGKVKGEFFVPDGYSRNKRFYSKSLWDKQLAKNEVKENLASRRMFGTIGHDQELNDSALRDGKVSHIVTDLRIENGKGMGEALILGTPAGEVLNTVLRAGAKLFVSSRANGQFKGSKDGVPSVDEDTYALKGFDVVIDPGFLQAQPELVESLNQLGVDADEEAKVLNEIKNPPEVEDAIKRLEQQDKNKKKKLKPKDGEGEEEGDTDEGTSDTSTDESFGDLDTGDDDMSETAKLLESLSAENNKLKGDLDTLLTDNEDLKKSSAVLQDENEHLKEQLSACSDADKKLEGYKHLGTPEEIDAAFDKSEPLLAKYKELGTPEEIDAAITVAEEQDKNRKVFEAKHGSPEKVGENLANLKKFEALGTFEQVDKALDAGTARLEEYKELGTPKEIDAALDKTEEIVEQQKGKQTKAKAAKIAEELGVSEDAIKTLLDKGFTEEEAIDHVKKINEQASNSNRWKKNGGDGGKKPTDDGYPLHESRTKRLVDSFSK